MERLLDYVGTNERKTIIGMFTKPKINCYIERHSVNFYFTTVKPYL